MSQAVNHQSGKQAPIITQYLLRRVGALGTAAACSGIFKRCTEDRKLPPKVMAQLACCVIKLRNKQSRDRKAAFADIVERVLKSPVRKKILQRMQVVTNERFVDVQGLKISSVLYLEKQLKIDQFLYKQCAEVEVLQKKIDAILTGEESAMESGLSTLQFTGDVPKVDNANGSPANFIEALFKRLSEVVT